MDLEKLLSELSGNTADIFLTAGKIPFIRRNGAVIGLKEKEIVAAGDLLEFRKKNLSPAEEKNYEKTGECDAACLLDQGNLRLRLNFYDTFCGPALAARIIRSGEDLDFGKLCLPGILSRFCMESRGILLLCGSTGCGKSTTMGAIINGINSNCRKHILIIEDPVEFVYKDKMSLISQREITANEGGYPAAFHAALRENPDVIAVGELRDAETMKTALNAALTGHLVITTLHTSDAIGAVERLLSMFPENERRQAAEDLGSSLNAIVAQRLLQKADKSGMIPACEILIGTPSVRKGISEQNYDTLYELLRSGGDSGMLPFVRDIYRLYKEKKITLEEAKKAVSSQDEFSLLLKGMESGVAVFRNNYANLSEEDRDLVDIRALLRCAAKNKASDLVLSAHASPSLRLNGEIHALDLPALQPQDVQRLLFSILNPKQKIELEEKRELDLALSMSISERDGLIRQVRFRLNAFYQRASLGVVARTIADQIPVPEELGLPGVLSSLIKKKQGLILVTGPTGSGKSTTLASLIDEINRTRSAHIITIEDPIEYLHPNKNSIVEQRELNSDTHTFSSALKHALRQSPDVIMVGEMRDVETISSALTAAETGHLVFGTIHTNSAAQTIDRIVDSFPQGQQNQIRQQLAGVILGIVSQRLIQRIDREGRAAAFEIMIGTAPVQALVREGKTHQLQSVLETGFKDGMITMERSLKNLYELGQISYEDTQAFSVESFQLTE